MGVGTDGSSSRSFGGDSVAGALTAGADALTEAEAPEGAAGADALDGAAGADGADVADGAAAVGEPGDVGELDEPVEPAGLVPTVSTVLDGAANDCTEAGAVPGNAENGAAGRLPVA